MKMDQNPEIVFVLVGTTHSGNIGAAARAIKNMGFSQLRLVDGCAHMTKDALARASGADGVLQKAERHTTLDAAIADCQVVIGTSARDRNLSVPLKDCRDVTAEIAGQIAEGVQRVAFVFGRERSGLSNEELDKCTRLLRIPCNPEFSSLNLGSAVQVVAYECSLALKAHGQDRDQATSITSATSAKSSASEDQAASSEAMQFFFEHLHRVMVNTGFLDPDNPRQLMRRIRRYFERNRPSNAEINILRGILSSTEKPYPPKDKDSQAGG